MLQVNSPYSLMQEMFARAANMQAGAIRLDVAPALIFPSSSDQPDFSGLDEITSLAQQYHLRVVADLFTIPSWLANCQTPTDQAGMARCGTDDLAGYNSVISQIVTHAGAVIHDWEIWNEPDSNQFFTGTPAQYAGMLRTAHDAIKQIDPQANVLLGGISNLAGMSWLAQVFATPGDDAEHAFDTANVHERGGLDALLGDIDQWRWFLAGHGFTGPLWVTEHGYPADPAYEYDPSYTAGETSQAAYLTASIPTLIEAGASEVFVTERDNMGGQFASEGVLSGGVSDPAQPPTPVAERPAYGAVRAIADCYLTLGRDCPSAAPAATPAALAIAATRVGSTSISPVTISDPGPAPLALSPAALAPGGSPDISLQPDTCPTILEPNQTCTLQLRFAPVSGGDQAATLELPSDNGTLSVAVSAVAPSVSSLTVPQLPRPSFTARASADGVGSTQRLVLHFANPLSAPVRITGATLGGVDSRQFRVPSSPCTQATVAPGRTCELSVLFEPTRAGTAHGVLTLRGDGQPLLITLQATAYAPPSVRLLGATGSAACFSRASGNQVLVATDQPSTVTWRVVRLGRAAVGACRTAPGSGGAGNPSGASATAGRVATSANLARIRGLLTYVARFRLPVHAGRGGLRPGLYDLNVAATDAHGTSPARTMLLTVTG
jgi:hypothetical protein